MWTRGFYKYEHLYTAVSYTSTKTMMNMDLHMMLTVLMDFAYNMTFMNFKADSMNTLQFKQMMNLTVC